MNPITAYALGVLTGLILMGLAAWATWPVEIKTDELVTPPYRRNWRDHDPHEDASIG